MMNDEFDPAIYFWLLPINSLNLLELLNYRLILFFRRKLTCGRQATNVLSHALYLSCRRHLLI